MRYRSAARIDCGLGIGDPFAPGAGSGKRPKAGWRHERSPPLSPMLPPSVLGGGSGQQLVNLGHHGRRPVRLEPYACVRTTVQTCAGTNDESPQLNFNFGSGIHFFIFVYLLYWSSIMKSFPLRASNGSYVLRARILHLTSRISLHIHRPRRSHVLDVVPARTAMYVQGCVL